MKKGMAIIYLPIRTKHTLRSLCEALMLCVVYLIQARGMSGKGQKRKGYE